MRSGVWYHEDFALKGYPTLRHRVKPGFEGLQDLIREGKLKVFVPRVTSQTEELLGRVHSPNHIQMVIKEGYHDIALLSAAGVIEAAECLAKNQLDFAFCFVGTAGHHASRNGYWGFCYYNDVAMAVVRLREMGIKRIMIIDVDPHFGDGTRDLLGSDPDVIHINFHEDDGLTLAKKELNNYDLGLYNADDSSFLRALDRVLQKDWDFDFLIVIFGHDSHCQDYGGFYLTEIAYPEMARLIKDFAGEKPVLFVLSGGSNPEVAKEVIPGVVKVFAG